MRREPALADDVRGAGRAQDEAERAALAAFERQHNRRGHRFAQGFILTQRIVEPGRAAKGILHQFDLIRREAAQRIGIGQGVTHWHDLNGTDANEQAARRGAFGDVLERPDRAGRSLVDDVHSPGCLKPRAGRADHGRRAGRRGGRRTEHEAFALMVDPHAGESLTNAEISLLCDIGEFSPTDEHDGRMRDIARLAAAGWIEIDDNDTAGGVKYRLTPKAVAMLTARGVGLNEA